MGLKNCDIEDLLQDILLISWKKLPEFEYNPEIGKFRAWLNTITKRDALHFLQKKQKRKECSYEEDIESLGFKDCELDHMINSEWETYISEKAWEKIKTKFSEKVLECFKALIEGKSGEVVSQELNLSINSVYVYKKRVLAALQKEIAYLDH